MTHAELIDNLEQGIRRHASDDALVFTFIVRSSRGLGVRVRLLDHREDGTRIYGVDRKTAVRWLKKLRAEATP